MAMATATQNPFDLLGDDDNGDITEVVFVPKEKEKAVVKKTQVSVDTKTAPAKLPSKPLPPAQAVREARNGGSRGGRGGRGGRNQDGGYSNPGRGNYGDRFNRDSSNENNHGNGYQGGSHSGGGFYRSGDEGFHRQEDGEFGSSERVRGYGGRNRGSRGIGGRRGYGNGATDDSERPRRQYERRSGTGRGYEVKREGAGRGNWGTPTDQGLTQEPEEIIPAEEEKITSPEKQQEHENNEEAEKKSPAGDSTENKEEEVDKEMTLDEYEKLLEEKRKNLLAMKSEERKVDEKEFESMQRLSAKKTEDVFIKLGSEKEMARRKEIADREERVKKSMNINEFLKPVDGENYYAPSGRGRGRGRGRGGFRSGYDGGNAHQATPKIEDPGQFPTLGGK